MTRTGITRRVLLALAPAGVASTLGCRGGRNDDRPELRIGVVTTENEADRRRRHQPLADHLGQALRRRAVLRQATDYAGVIEAMKSRQIELAYFGPASYAQAWLVMSGRVEPLCASLDQDGEFGSHSVIAVRADSPYRSLDDLKGKSLALADPNSTTGHQAPVYFLAREGKAPREHFGELVFSGNHETSILALLSGTYDAAATWWTNQRQGNIQRMERKSMIPRGSTRIVWTSPRIPSNVWAADRDLAPDLKAVLRRTLLNVPRDAPSVWRAFSDGQESGLRAVTHQDYQPIVDMIQANLRERRPGR